MSTQGSASAINLKLKLKREISPLNLLFLSFSAIFGSGWLFAPLYAAQTAGAGSIVAWLLAGLMSVVIGLTMAEVITLFPKSGGLNQAANETHGEFLGLTVTFLNLIVFLILPALEVRAIIQYLSSYFASPDNPLGAIQLIGADDRLTTVGTLFSSLLLLSILVCNLMGAKITGKMNALLVLFKLITPVLMIGAFLYALRDLGRLNLNTLVSTPLRSANPHEYLDLGSVFTAIATCGIMFSYNGFNQATVFAGEAENPKRSIPFAIIGSVTLAGVLYLLVQTLFLIAVPADSLSQGWSQLSFSGDQGPFAGLAKLLGLGGLLGLIYADAFFSPAGTAFSYSSAAPRLLYSLAENSGSFNILKKLNKNGAPIAAIFLAFVIEIAALYYLASLKAMIGILVAAFVTCYTVVPASLILLRKTKPTLDRPFRLPAYGAFAFLSLFFSNLMVFSCGWACMQNLILTTLVIWILSFLICQRNPSQRGILKTLVGSEWFILQILGIAALAYLKNLEKLDFAMTALIIAVFSLGLLFLSLKTGLRRRVSS